MRRRSSSSVAVSGRACAQAPLSLLPRTAVTGAISHLASRADTTGDGEAVMVVNALAFERDAVATVTVFLPGFRGARVTDADGAEIPAVTEAVVRSTDDTLELTLTFLARRVPARDRGAGLGGGAARGTGTYLVRRPARAGRCRELSADLERDRTGPRDR